MLVIWLTIIMPLASQFEEVLLLQFLVRLERFLKGIPDGGEGGGDKKRTLRKYFLHFMAITSI